MSKLCTWHRCESYKMEDTRHQAHLHVDNFDGRLQQRHQIPGILHGRSLDNLMACCKTARLLDMACNDRNTGSRNQARRVL